MLPETSNTIANMGVVCAFMMVLFIHLPYTKDASAMPPEGQVVLYHSPDGALGRMRKYLPKHFCDVLLWKIVRMYRFLRRVSLLSEYGR